MIIKGRVHKFGDDINTDDIIAAKYLDSQDAQFLGSKCMKNIDPRFSRRVKKGDIIIGGKNFGCGSSREHAPWAIKGCGVALVVARSFARIFYRNCINVGLPILVFRQVDKISNGDTLKVDLSRGLIHNVSQGQSYMCERFPPFMEAIIKRGGLINWVKKRKSNKDIT